MLTISGRLAAAVANVNFKREKKKKILQVNISRNDLQPDNRFQSC